MSWSQLNYPVQKIIKGGDTLVIMTKTQADQLVSNLKDQVKVTKSLKQKYTRLEYNHQRLIEEYGKVKLELSRTNTFNDSVMNYLGDNMALLFKTKQESDVYFVNLRHYIVDVFENGTIVLNSPVFLKQKEYDRHLKFEKDWRYINIANEFRPDRRFLIDFVRLFPERWRNEERIQNFYRQSIVK